MKQYDRFGEYMFDLLFAPLKKGKRAFNQFFIFFKVIGRVFDGLKEDALRVRDETNIATASPVMLPVHGQDRNMPRLAGESVEGYRTRLAMKGIIAEKGGLKEGIRYVLTALGYEQSIIEPLAFHAPARWAEFTVRLGVGKEDSVKNFYAIVAEIQRVKEASSRLACLVSSVKPLNGSIHLGGVMASVVRIYVPELKDVFDYTHALRTGGQVCTQITMPLPELRDRLNYAHVLHTGGKACTCMVLPLPEHK